MFGAEAAFFLCGLDDIEAALLSRAAAGDAMVARVMSTVLSKWLIMSGAKAKAYSGVIIQAKGLLPIQAETKKTLQQHPEAQGCFVVALPLCSLCINANAFIACSKRSRCETHC